MKVSASTIGRALAPKLLQVRIRSASRRRRSRSSAGLRVDICNEAPQVLNSRKVYRRNPEPEFVTDQLGECDHVQRRDVELPEVRDELQIPRYVKMLTNEVPDTVSINATGFAPTENRRPPLASGGGTGV